MFLSHFPNYLITFKKTPHFFCRFSKTFSINIQTKKIFFCPIVTIISKCYNPDEKSELFLPEIPFQEKPCLIQSFLILLFKALSKMIHKIKTIFLGSPLPTEYLKQTRLGVFKALACFSPDALSSIAYANQEIFLGLAAAGSAGLLFTFPIGLVIVLVLAVVALSYYQTIQAYPSGGGSYAVAKENLGEYPGLIAAAALLLDYLLTAAVSLSAGVEALASAFPVLWPCRIQIALGLLVFITLINLRGIQETGTILAFPVYFFVITYSILILYGFFRILSGDMVVTTPAPTALQPLSFLLLIRAFSSGSTALTGIEAISNGVPVFKQPESRHAGTALILMALLMAFLFLGTLGLTQYFHIVPSGSETILSALARGLFSHTFLYFLVQISTLLVLTVAANTAYTGFPRVVAILARDGYMPRQLQMLGDRLVFANGILLLSLGTGFLILIFQAKSHALIPLFAVGAFLAFTFSQAGMVVHWLKVKGNFWGLKAVLNGFGALTTGIMLLIVGGSKFVQGAWITLVIIPALFYLFLRIKNHYLSLTRQLSVSGLPVRVNSAAQSSELRLVIPVSGIHKGVVEAVKFSLSISRKITAVYIEVEPDSSDSLRLEWKKWFPDLPLAVVQSPYRSIIGPLLHFLDEYDQQCNDGKLAGVVIPEYITSNLFENFLHNQMAWLIKFVLLYRRRELGYQRVIIDIPYHLLENRKKGSS